LFVLAGIVVGGLIGAYLGDIPGFNWLNFGDTFGVVKPFVLDLKVIALTFGLTVTINVSSIIGMLIAVLIFRKL
jgi:hypothetical protein